MENNQLKMKTYKGAGLYKSLFRLTGIVLITILSATNLIAQEDVQINGHDVGSWFERNWMYITGGIILLLLIILIATKSSGKVRKTTTIVKDDYGNVKSVTTTEER